MKRERMRISIFIIFVYLLLFARVNFAQDVRAEEKLYTLSVCAIFRNEAKYLKEWIEYHRLAGVDHFYLYSIGSTDQFRKILRPYIADGIITLVEWPAWVGGNGETDACTWALSTQIPAYENALHRWALQETKWLAFLDIDQFLVSPNSSDLKDLLQKYENCPGILLSSDCFDASKSYHIFPPRRLVIETLELANEPPQKLQMSIAKIIFQPEFYNGFTWPPYQCAFKDNLVALNVQREEVRINHYINRYAGLFAYAFKSKLEIDNRLLSKDEINELLRSEYEIEDQDQVIYRFLPEMHKRMGF